MDQRLKLQMLLENILGSPNVYFQPPNNYKMQYPCIVYNRDRESVKHANNLPYNRVKGYQVTYIGRDPDSDTPDKIAQLPMCSFSTAFTADNLNHTVYNLYF